ncbi:MAG TPA: PEGA domain-containing protein, partial [Aggregicoccus sp.]|nr:PEGA domain-containing protein [Aggregicoccus sp.]
MPRTPSVPLPAPALAAALALALLLLSAPAAAASSTADEADVAFELGNEAYAKGNFHLALQQYFTSYRLVPNRSVLFNIARSYEALERYTEAYRYYEDLAAQADALDAGDATEVRRSLERLRPRVALVRVESTPRGAEVYVNRLDLGSRGKTPLTLAIPPGGRHRLLLRREGYRPAEAWVAPVKGRQLLQSFELALITGTVELLGSPAGAQVREGGPAGPLLGEVPARLALAPGRHLLHVSAKGHASRTLQVEVPAEGSVQAQVELGPDEGPSGQLRVTASREGARVRVDGRPVGLAPLSLTLPEGEHVLEVESDEVRPVRQVVRVEQDRELPVHVELRYLPPPVQAATRSPSPVDEVPASTTVITQEELRAFGYSTLAEALAGVRGFFLTDDRRYITVGVRGLAPPGDLSSRVRVLWDGHPMHDAVTGHGPVGRDLAVDLDEVERIEVVRGPLSELYGSGALLGVINVVPRASLGAAQHLEVTGALGALGALRGHATAAWESTGSGAVSGGSSVLLSAAVSRMRGADFTALGEGLPTVEGLDAERSAGASVRARVGGLTLLGQLDARRKELPTAPAGTAVGAPGTQVQDVRGFAEARYE